MKKLEIPKVSFTRPTTIGSGKLKYPENTISERTTKTLFELQR